MTRTPWLFTTLCLINLAPALADIVATESVVSLARAPQLVTKLLEAGVDPDVILVASDWDDVITSKKGGAEELKEGGITAAALEQLSAQGIRFAILTSRGKGMAPDLMNFRTQKEVKKIYSELISAMHNILARNLSLNPIVANTFFSDLSDIDSNTIVVPQKISGLMLKQRLVEVGVHINTSLAMKGIIFGGAAAIARKGEVLAYFIDNSGHRINGKKPEYIIFIDDDPEQIVSMSKAFEKRDEKTFLLYLSDETAN